MVMSLPPAPSSQRGRSRRPRPTRQSNSNGGTAVAATSSSSNSILKQQRRQRLVFVGSVLCFGSVLSLLPIVLLETTTTIHNPTLKVQRQQGGDGAKVSVERLIHNNPNKKIPTTSTLQQQQISLKDYHGRSGPPRLPDKLSELPWDDDEDFLRDVVQPLARGVAGVVDSSQPAAALEGARRAHIECDHNVHNVDSLAYWNDPQGIRDQEFTSPFAVSDASSEKYISFAPDPGGWNNIRMSMEIIFLLSAITNRTLVLPPKAPLYLLHHGKKGDKHRGFADFFPLDTEEFQKRVRTISMKEFLELQQQHNNSTRTIPTEAVLNAAEHCDKRKASKASCTPLWEYIESVATLPNISSRQSCLVFDQDVYKGKSLTPERQELVKRKCGTRDIVYWNNEPSDWQQSNWLHFRASQKEFRLLTHFYAMIHFTNATYDNYYKRFVRDFLHYHDAIFCAAGKIVKALQWEASQRNNQQRRSGDSSNDVNSGAGTATYSAMHVRRGDLQYKKVKLSAQEWYDNTKEIGLDENELLYIATDERNKTFFHDLAVHYDLRFLDDYWELAGLDELDGNYMGMIDTIVASRGRVFVGTWFSTFTGYINRMRGYHGLSMKDSWYSFLPKKTAVHVWPDVTDARYAFEWPDGWVEIDGDEWPTKTKF